MASLSGKTEIRIRKLSYVDAKQKLIAQLNSAFIQGKKRVHVIHGVGEGKLKAMTANVVTELCLGSIVEDPLEYNPGVTIVDLNPPDDSALRRYMK